MNPRSLLAGIALACFASPCFAGFVGGGPSLPSIKPPRIDVKPPRIDFKPPDLSKLDPTKKLKAELEKARASAMRGLNRFSPDNVLANVRRSIQQNLSKAQAGAGVRYNRSTGELDLRGSRIGGTLRSWVEKFAQGNERSSAVEALSYNVRTQVLVARLMARHRQVQNWGALGRVTVYDCTQRASFTFDFRNRSADYNLDLGPLAPKINKRGVEALSKGDLVAAAEAAAPDLSKVVRYERKNDYDEVLRKFQARYGAGRVYLSSREFVGWAGSRSIGKYAATGAISGGSAVWPQIMRDAKEMASKEGPRIVAWLERLGVREARAMVPELLTGRKPRWPNVKFEMVVIPHYAREVSPQTGLKTPWRRFNNLGFVIVVQPGTASR